jgi:hypothetical protein
VYYVLKTEDVLAKIRVGLESAALYGVGGPVSHKDAKILPYLEAVIRESIRIHPGFALVLEREVPEEAFTSLMAMLWLPEQLLVWTHG